jgi:hypothetical protein
MKNGFTRLSFDGNDGGTKLLKRFGIGGGSVWSGRNAIKLFTRRWSSAKISSTVSSALASPAYSKIAQYPRGLQS